MNKYKLKKYTVSIDIPTPYKKSFMAIHKSNAESEFWNWLNTIDGAAEIIKIFTAHTIEIKEEK